MQEHTQDGWSPRMRRVRPVRERHGSGSSARRRLFSKDELSVRCAREGDREVVAAAGRLDLSSAWQLERELRRAEATDAHEILVDLGGLRFVDRAGVAVVAQAGARTRYHSKQLMIAPAPDAVQRTFERSDLRSLLPFVVPAPAVALL